MIDYTEFTSYFTTVEERREKRVGDIFINQAKCKKCGWYIRSKNRHHVDTCKCGAVSIDGGSEYVRILGKPDDYELHTLRYFHQPEEKDPK